MLSGWGNFARRMGRDRSFMQMMKQNGYGYGKGRKAAFAAMGKLSPDYYVQDGVIPRTRLPEVLNEIEALGEKHGYRVANVFHAGDGNLHPLILYNNNVPGELEAVEGFGW